jgi:hypothetical protein
VLRPLIPFIDGILEMGRKALQRHTAHPVAADSRGDTGAAGGGIDDSPVRTRAQARTRLVKPDDLRAAVIRIGPGGSGRLVRGLGGVKWRGGTVAGILDAQHGERRCLSSSLSARDSAKRSSKLTSTRLDILVASSGSCAMTI